MNDPGNIRFGGPMSPSPIDLIRHLEAGGTATCFRCGSPLLVALSWELAATVNRHPGIYCPKDNAHVFIMVEPQKP